MRTLCLLVAVGAIGCGDDGPAENPDLSIVTLHNFDQINTYVLGPLCSNFSVCHSTQGQRDAGHLDLQKGGAAGAYAALVGVLSDNKMAGAEGKVRVVPCDPDDSFLYIKLTLPETQKDSKVGYGASMPKDNPHLPMEQLQAIRDWIARGAREHEPADVTGTTCMTDDASVQDLSSVD
jgi:hypothetical protein